jgi:alpha-glucosidase
MRRWLLVVFATSFSFAQAPPPATGAGRPQTLGRVTSVQIITSGAELRTATGAMRVTALTDSIIRVRVAPGGKFPVDHSFAVLAEDAAALKPTSTPRVNTTPD